MSTTVRDASNPPQYFVFPRPGVNKVFYEQARSPFRTYLRLLITFRTMATSFEPHDDENAIVNLEEQHRTSSDPDEVEKISIVESSVDTITSSNEQKKQVVESSSMEMLPAVEQQQHINPGNLVVLLESSNGSNNLDEQGCTNNSEIIVDDDNNNNNNNNNNNGDGYNVDNNLTGISSDFLLMHTLDFTDLLEEVDEQLQQMMITSLDGSIATASNDNMEDFSTTIGVPFISPCSSTSTPLISNVLPFIKSNITNNNNHTNASQEEESTTSSPENSFLWYYPKSLFATPNESSSTTTTPAYNNNDVTWWWNLGATDYSNADLSPRPQDVLGSNTTTNTTNDGSTTTSSTTTSLLLRTELQHALQQQSNDTTTHTNNREFNKLVVVRNGNTGCTAIQLGEETFRITIIIPRSTVSQVMKYVSNPNTLASWCDTILTTTNTANSSSSTTTTSRSTTIQQTSNTQEKRQEEFNSSQQQQVFDAEWYEAMVTLRNNPTCCCCCYKSSSKLTLFVDYRRSRICITYILGGYEVNHTFTFTTNHEEDGVHVKDTLRVIPILLDTSTNENNNSRSSSKLFYLCIRPILFKYFLPSVHCHMKRAMTSLENLQLEFISKHHETTDDLTTPLL